MQQIKTQKQRTPTTGELYIKVIQKPKQLKSFTDEEKRARQDDDNNNGRGGEDMRMNKMPAKSHV